MTNGTRRGWEVSVTRLLLFTPGKNSVSILQEVGWAQGPIWTGAENLAPPPGFDSQTVQPVASRYTDYATRHTSDVRWWIGNSLRKRTVVPYFKVLLQNSSGGFTNTLRVLVYDTLFVISNIWWLLLIPAPCSKDYRFELSQGQGYSATFLPYS
jgi:hypothetical protein